MADLEGTRFAAKGRAALVGRRGRTGKSGAVARGRAPWVIQRYNSTCRLYAEACRCAQIAENGVSVNCPESRPNAVYEKAS